MAEVPQMSLKVAPMQFATFTPVQYTPQMSDPTLLSKSMQQQEARQKEANQYLLAIDSTLAEKRKLLNKADYDWLAEQADAIRKDIDAQLELGNWQTAIHLSQQAAKDLSRNTELEDRIRANEIYTTERNKIQSGNYSSYTKRRWDDVNKYRFNGTADWTADFTPTTDMSIADVWNLAVGKTPVRQDSHTSSKTRDGHTFTDNAGNLVTNPTETYTDELGNSNTRIAQGIVGQYSNTTTTRVGGKTVTEKREADIINMFNDMLKDPSIRAALRQEFDNMNWLYERATRVLKDPNATATQIKQAQADLDTATSSLSNRDGFLYLDKDDDPDNNFDAWLGAQASQYAKDSAYTHITTNTTDNVTTSYSDSASAHVKANQDAMALGQYGYDHATTEGPNITYQTVPDRAGYSAEATLNYIFNRDN